MLIALARRFTRVGGTWLDELHRPGQARPGSTNVSPLKGARHSVYLTRTGRCLTSELELVASSRGTIVSIGGPGRRRREEASPVLDQG